MAVVRRRVVGHLKNGTANPNSGTCKPRIPSAFQPRCTSWRPWLRCGAPGNPAHSPARTQYAAWRSRSTRCLLLRPVRPQNCWPSAPQRAPTEPALAPRACSHAVERAERRAGGGGRDRQMRAGRLNIPVSIRRVHCARGRPAAEIPLPSRRLTSGGDRHSVLSRRAFAAPIERRSLAQSRPPPHAPVATCERHRSSPCSRLQQANAAHDDDKRSRLWGSCAVTRGGSCCLLQPGRRAG